MKNKSQLKKLFTLLGITLILSVVLILIPTIYAVDIRVSDNNAYNWITSNTNITVNTYNQTWLEFDGVNDNVSIPNNPTLNFEYDKNYTIIFQFRCLVNPSASQFFFEKESNFDSFIGSGGVINIRNGASTGLWTPDGGFCDNNIHEVTFTAKSRGIFNTTNLYIDGFNLSEGNTVGFNASSSSPLLLGQRTSGNFLNASMYFFKVYNYSFNATQVQNHYYGFSIDGYENTENWDEFDYINNTGVVLVVNGNDNEFDRYSREDGNVLFNTTGNGAYQFFYTGYNGTYLQNNTCIGWANSSDGIIWNKQNKTFGCGSGWGDNVGNASEDPYVVYNGSTYFMYVEDKEFSPFQNISLYMSDNLINWKDVGVVLSPSQPFDLSDVSSPTVLIENGLFYMFYEGRNTSQSGRIGLATSTNGINWIKKSDNPYVKQLLGSWNTDSIVPDEIIKKNGIYYLQVHGDTNDVWNVGMITFTNLTDKNTFVRQSKNPMLNFNAYYFNDNSTNWAVEGSIMTLGKTAKKITSEFNSTVSILDLKLNENSGTTAYDISGNGNNGTISGATWNNDGNLVSTLVSLPFLNLQGSFLQYPASLLWSYFVSDTKPVVDYILLNNTHSSDSYELQIYNLTNAFIYFSNGSVKQGGDQNITIQAGEQAYIYNNWTGEIDTTLNRVYKDPITISGNLTFTGTGTAKFESNLIFSGSDQYIFQRSGSTYALSSGA